MKGSVGMNGIERGFGALVAAAAALVAMPCLADEALQVRDAWVRATVPGQPVAAGYLTLQARMPLRVVRVEAAPAAFVQIHEMKMDGGVMKMRELKSLDLPAGHTVHLEPGGVHLMLLDLKQPLRAGQNVRLSFTVEDGRGRHTVQVVDAPVKSAPPR
jgi:periplasmic copper chaperone A